MKTIDDHKARLGEIKARLEEIHKEFAGKRFSDDAKGEWNSLHTERDEIVETVRELEQREEQMRNAIVAGEVESGGAHFNTRSANAITGEDVYNLAEYRNRATSPEKEVELLGDGVKRALDSAHFEHRSANREDCQEHVSRLSKRHSRADGGMLDRYLLATGSPTYKRAFGKALCGAPLSDQETRALSLSGSAGGYAVPFTLDPTVVPTSNAALNPLRKIARVETTVTNEYKLVTSGGITAAYAAEGTEASDNSPTLAQPDLVCDRAQAFVPYSIELSGDWGGLLETLAAEIQDAKDAVEATKFTKGAGHGSNEPKGIITGATGTVAAGSAAFAVAHLYALHNALAPRWRPNASFMAENTQFDRIRQFDTAGGASLWTQLEFDKPANLIGRPAYENSEMDSALTNGQKIMVYGDFSKFIIVDRIGLSVEIISHLFGASNRPTGQRGAYAIWRNTSDVVTANAFKVLETSA